MIASTFQKKSRSVFQQEIKISCFQFLYHQNWKVSIQSDFSPVQENRITGEHFLSKTPNSDMEEKVKFQFLDLVANIFALRNLPKRLERLVGIVF